MERADDVIKLVESIHNKKKIELTFFSKKDNTEVVRICAPMDYSPSKRAKDKSNRFHFWDYESPSGNHTLSLLPKQIVCLNPIDESFDPSEFVTWEPNWTIERNWGVYS